MHHVLDRYIRLQDSIKADLERRFKEEQTMLDIHDVLVIEDIISEATTKLDAALKQAKKLPVSERSRTCDGCTLNHGTFMNCIGTLGVNITCLKHVLMKIQTAVTEIE